MLIFEGAILNSTLFLFSIGFLEIRWVDIIDVILVTFLLFQVYKLLQGSVASKIFIGILFIYLFFLNIYETNLMEQNYELSKNPILHYFHFDPYRGILIY